MAAVVIDTNVPFVATFDPDDRIFAAVPAASGLHSKILNASDTDWWPLRKGFEGNRVFVRFLCENLMKHKD